MNRMAYINRCLTANNFNQKRYRGAGRGTSRHKRWGIPRAAFVGLIIRPSAAIWWIIIDLHISADWKVARLKMNFPHVLPHKLCWYSTGGGGEAPRKHTIRVMFRNWPHWNFAISTSELLVAGYFKDSYRQSQAYFCQSYSQFCFVLFQKQPGSYRGGGDDEHWYHQNETHYQDTMPYTLYFYDRWQMVVYGSFNNVPSLYPRTIFSNKKVKVL